MLLVASIGLRVGMAKSVSIHSQKDAETNKNLGGVTSVSFPTAIPAVKSHSAFVSNREATIGNCCGTTRLS